MEKFIEVLVFATTLYAIIGVIFSCVFVIWGMDECDPSSIGARVGFKCLMIPGLIIFWPLFAIRWIIGVKRPAPERNAHRIAAKTYHNR